jgi:hypothetical protein
VPFIPIKASGERRRGEGEEGRGKRRGVKLKVVVYPQDSMKTTDLRLHAYRNNHNISYNKYHLEGQSLLHLLIQS